MPTQDKDTLKSYFNTGDRPTEQNFADLIDSTVSKVNNMLPDAQGNVTVTNIDGTASTITGTISKNQVTGLQADLDAKVNSNNIKTVNSQAVVGTGNISINPAFKENISVIKDPYTILGNSNPFPINSDRFDLPPNKTYLFKGKYFLSNPSATSRIIRISFITSGYTTTSMHYVARVFHGNSGAMSAFRITGTGSVDLGPTTAATLTTIEFEGVFRCTGTGTGTTAYIIPKLAFNAIISDNVNGPGSFLVFTEIGDDQTERFGDAVN